MGGFLWIKDGYVLAHYGRPIICDKWPDCRNSPCNTRALRLITNAQQETMSDGLTPKYTVIREWTETEYDFPGIGFHSASGKMIVAFSVPIGCPDFSSSPSAVFFAGAAELQDNETLERIVVGCECGKGYSDSDPRGAFSDTDLANDGLDLTREGGLLSLSGYSIGGLVPVLSSAEGTEGAEGAEGTEGTEGAGSTGSMDREDRVCKTDPCSLHVLYLQFLAKWLEGAVFTGEGYIRRTDGTVIPSMATLRYTCNGAAKVVYVGCEDCEFYELEGASVVEVQAMSLYCTNPCGLAVEMLEAARAAGKTCWNEGVLVGRRTDDTSLYDVRNRVLFLACVDEGDHYSVMSCDCSLGAYSKASDYYGAQSSIDDYWLPIEKPGACACFDERELLLENPDIFGVVDYSWGSHTTYSYTSTYEDIMHGGMVTDTGNRLVYHGPCANDVESGYIDYRTLVVKIALASGKAVIQSYSPPDSEVPDIKGTFDEADLTGHALLFRQPIDTERWRMIGGDTYSAQFTSEHMGMPEPCSTLEEANAWIALGTVRADGLFFLHNYFQAHENNGIDETEMNCSPKVRPARIEYYEGATPPYYAFRAYEYGLAFCVRFIRTNRGFLRESKPGEYFKEIYLPSQKELVDNCGEGWSADQYTHDGWGDWEHGQTLTSTYDFKEEVDCDGDGLTDDEWRNPDLADETLDEGESEEGDAI